MKLKKQMSGRFWFFLGSGLLSAGSLAGVQSVIMSPPVTPVTPVDAQEQPPGAMDVFAPAGAGNNLPTQPFQYGPVTVRPHVSYQFLYGNGIQAGPTNQQATAIQTISPGILLDLGKHWSLDYTPTFRFYSNNQFKDGVDHSLSLAGGTHYEDWTFGLSQIFLYTTAPTAETGAQTEQQIFGTALSASRLLNDRMSVDFGLSQNFSYAESLQNSRVWSTMDWLNYQFWPRLTAGIGAGAGYVSVDTGPDQTYEQLQARVNWRATDKVSFQISGGGDDRQFAGSSQPDSITPIFSASIQYLPFKDTQISVSASRAVAPSLFQGADTETTSFGANINQRLFKKFSLNVGVGYNTSKYVETEVINLGPVNLLYVQNRTDDYYSFNARLSHPLFRRGTWGISYQYNDNQSTAAGFSYKGSQAGFDVSYSY